MKLLNSFAMLQMSGVLILGFCLVAILAIALPPPNFEPGANFEECKNKTYISFLQLGGCFHHVFSNEQMNETHQLYGDTKCLRCMHFCRKKTDIMNCLHENLDTFKEISTKSRTMVPFLLQLSDVLLTGLCDENGIFPASNVDDKQCFRKSWNDCGDHLYFLDDLEIAIFCDSANPEKDPFTKEFICQRFWDHHKCTERSVKKCSPELMSTQAVLGNMIRNSDSCIKYLQTSD